MIEWPVEASSTAELAERFGPAGLRVERYNSKDEKELWLLRRYLFTLAANQLLPFPVCVTRSEAPDFLISSGDEAAAGLEVTEATLSSDARERFLARRATGFELIGSRGGRGRDGFEGDKPERMWCADVIRAIQRKLRKPYASQRLKLLIYANSNPALVVHASCAARMLQTKLHGRSISGIQPADITTSIVSGDFAAGDCLIHNATVAPKLFPLVNGLE